MAVSRYTGHILCIAMLILVCCTSPGCLQLNKKTQTISGVLGSVSVTEITYLWGEDGPFTHRYIVDMRILGGSAHVEMSRREYLDLLSSIGKGS